MLCTTNMERHPTGVDHLQSREEKKTHASRVRLAVLSVANRMVFEVTCWR